MRQKLTILLPPALLAITAVLLLRWWLAHDPTADFSAHLPGMDGAPAVEAGVSEVTAIGQLFAAFPRPVKVPVTPGLWPQFRGPNRDNFSSDETRLAETWPATGPPRLWEVALGEGHAGAAVRNSRVYVLDYDEEKGADMLRCFSLADGSELWRRGYTVKVPRNHGMSRTVPAVTDQYVVSIGPKCHVMCVDAMTGKLRWGIDLVAEYGSKVPMWYTGQCPLIENGVAVIAPAGDEVLMLGIDCETGNVLWTTGNPGGLAMSHSSVMPAVIEGVRMYVYAATGGLVGVSAEPDNRGEILWHTKAWNRSVVAPSPIVMDDGRIFVTAGYGGGSMMLKVMRAAGKFEAEVLQEYKSSEGLASEQQTPILYKEHLFGILPKDAGPLRNQLVCVKADDTRQIAWASGKINRFGLGPYLMADGKILVLSDDGELTMLRASTQTYQELARAQVIENGHDAWAPMALAEGRLILRDDQKMICLDLREQIK
jgi:outer membrane protein assembly factor BamB